MLSDYFSRFIFDKVGVKIENGITLQELRNIMKKDQDGVELLDMFCGEGSVDAF